MKRIAFITGGTSGLGLQLVKDMLSLGYKVYSMSRNADKIDKNIKKCKDVIFIKGDVTNLTDVQNAVDVIRNENNCLDVLINNAGIIVPGGIESLTLADWDRMLAVNVTGIFTISKAMIPLLKESSGASIINVSSISSSMTGSSMAYSACKAAVDMMTKSMAKELSKYRIRVNSVNPGIMKTGFQIHNDVVNQKEYAEFLAVAENAYPLGIAGPEAVSNLIMFLISDKAKWITGSNYIIDGGRSVNI